MTLTIKLDRNWSSFQLANSAPPLSVTDSAIAPSARMLRSVFVFFACIGSAAAACFIACAGSAVLYVLCLLFRPGFACVSFFLFGCSYCWGPRAPQKFRKSHWCVPFTATFSKRRKIGSLWSERCDALHSALKWGTSCAVIVEILLETHSQGSKSVAARVRGEVVILWYVTPKGSLNSSKCAKQSQG